VWSLISSFVIIKHFHLIAANNQYLNYMPTILLTHIRKKLIYLLRESRICHNKYFMDSTKVTGKSENFEYFGHVEPRRQPLGKEQRALHYTVNGLSRTSSFRLD
jgi:hypothetical protein